MDKQKERLIELLSPHVIHGGYRSDSELDIKKVENLADEICQLFEPKPNEANGYLLASEQLMEIEEEARDQLANGAGRQEYIALLQWLTAKAQAALTSSILSAENRELGLLLKSRIGGIDEFNDWSEAGLRHFREGVLPIIREHCSKLEDGD